MDGAASKVNIHISRWDLQSHVSLILQTNAKGLSLSQLQKLNMEQLRPWEKFPPRILRSL
jgi:hypothetical protein